MKKPPQVYIEIDAGSTDGSHLKATGGNYQAKLVAMSAPGKLREFITRHDPWCDIFESKPCNCDPDVELIREF